MTTRQNWKHRLRSIPIWVWILSAFTVIAIALAVIFIGNSGRPQVSYSFFTQQLNSGNISQVTLQGNKITGKLKQTTQYGQPEHTISNFTTYIPSFGHTNLEPALDRHGVVVRVQSPSGSGFGAYAIVEIVSVLFLLGVLVWVLRRTFSSGGGLGGIGKSRAKRYKDGGNQTKVTFADVAGIEESKADLAQIVDFLKKPKKYQRLGGSIPKGVLLVGEPGTGKTLMAKAVAGEANVPFFSISGSEFIEMIVGVGASRVRGLFAEAKKEAPCIVFVDELDAIGRKRDNSAGNTGGGGEREQTLNQLLSEMDGFEAQQAVIVLAATNRPDVLDPALLRPGRFDRKVTVQKPDRVGREAILEVHSRDVPLDPDVDLDQVAAATAGMVGADLRNLINEAALLAARDNARTIHQKHMFEALEKIVLGTERKLVLTDQDRTLIAFHESGHALMGLLQDEADPVRKVSILPRGQALGGTYQTPEEDQYNYTETYLRTRLTTLLAGRASEQIEYGRATTGAEEDLKQATELARRMVTHWGMSGAIGLMYLPSDGYKGGQNPFAGNGNHQSDLMTEQVDREVQRIISECYNHAVDTLTRERARLDALVRALLEHESLNEREIREVAGLVDDSIQNTRAG